MSDEKTTEVKAEVKAEAPKPEINVDEITARITKDVESKAAKIAAETAAKLDTENRKRLAREIAGEPDEDAGTKLVKRIAQDPIGYSRDLKEITKKEIRAELAEERAFVEMQRSVVGPMVQEYPELNTPHRLKMVDKLAHDYASTGDMSFAAAYEKAGKEVISDYKLKSVKEAEQEAASKSVGFLPLGGGANFPGAPKFDDAKSTSDFISGIRSRSKAFKTRVIKDS